MSEEELIAGFNANDQFPGLKGTVVGARVVRDPKLTVGLGFGYVHFSTPAAASMALEVNGTKLGGRPLRVMHYKASKGGVGVGGKKGGVGSSSSRGSDSSRDRGLGKVRQGGVDKYKSQGGERGFAGKKSGPGDWQGVRTKGRGKVKGPRSTAGGGGGQGGHKRGSGSQTRPQGKRPAVAARKAAAKGQGGHSRPSKAGATGKNRGKGRP